MKFCYLNLNQILIFNNPQFVKDNKLSKTRFLPFYHLYLGITLDNND